MYKKKNMEWKDSLALTSKNISHVQKSIHHKKFIDF